MHNKYKNNLHIFIALSVFGVVNLFAVNFALSQAANCACNVPLGSAGAISEIKGDVLISQQAGFQSAQGITQFAEGSHIIIGQSSAAILSLPGCSVNLNKASTVSLVKVNNQLCLRVDETYAGTRVSSAPRSWVPAAIMGGVLAGGVIIAIADDGKPVSR